MVNPLLKKDKNTCMVVYRELLQLIFVSSFLVFLVAATTASSLIGCSAEDLILALSTQIIQAGKDNVAKRLTMQQVCKVLI